MGSTPGVEARELPLEPEVLDGGVMVQGLGVGGLARQRRRVAVHS